MQLPNHHQKKKKKKMTIGGMAHGMKMIMMIGTLADPRAVRLPRPARPRVTNRQRLIVTRWPNPSEVRERAGTTMIIGVAS